MNDVETLRAQGRDVETVGDIIEQGQQQTSPLMLLDPPRHGDTPPFPMPGIYFFMSDEDYHAIPALSASGIKKLAASPMIFWAASWMNQGRVNNETEPRVFGKAYHCRLMEGASAFAARFCVAIDRSKYPEALESTDEIKDWIGKQSYILHEQGGAPRTMPIKPVLNIEEDDGQGGVRKRKAKKDDWIAQALAIDPNVPLWSKIQERYIAEMGGRTMLPASLLPRLEIAARMIERDPGIAPLFKGGHAEVALFWYCPKTGVPMKAKIDYLKFTRMVDLKTLANQQERSFDSAILREIAAYKYNIQPSVYFEAAQEVRKIVREHGVSAIHIADDTDGLCRTVEECEAIQNWALKWASHTGHDEWTWVFQQKGDAPITRAVDYPRGGTTKMVTDEIVSKAKRTFRTYCDGFGLDPWLDIAPPYMLADEDIPNWSTEI